MKDGKEGLSAMTPAQILAMSALGQAPAILGPVLRMSGHRAPAVQPDRQQRPRPAHHALLERREAHRHLPAVDPDQRDGAQHHLHLVRRQDGFGLTGCRRTVPHLQRLLQYLDDELKALEKAAGIA